MTLMTAQDDRDKDTNTTLHMKPISFSIPLPQDHCTTRFDAACSYPDTSSMEATCPPTTKNFDHMYASMPCVNTTNLLDEDVHLKEMLVAQLDLIQQQAAMDRKNTQEELSWQLATTLVLLGPESILEHQAMSAQMDKTWRLFTRPLGCMVGPCGQCYLPQYQ